MKLTEGIGTWQAWFKPDLWMRRLRPHSLPLATIPLWLAAARPYITELCPQRSERSCASIFPCWSPARRPRRPPGLRAFRPVADRHRRAERTRAAWSGRWQRPYALFRDRDAWLSPARRIEILARAAALMQQRREALGRSRPPAKAESRWSIRSSRPIGRSTACGFASSSLRTQAGEEIPMGLNAASAGPAGLHAARADRRRRGVQRVQSPVEHDRPSGRARRWPPAARSSSSRRKRRPCRAIVSWAILREAGLPDAWCQAAGDGRRQLGPGTGLPTAASAFFSFIGSGAVGWMLRSHLAPGARCSLEHGGVAPVVVAADADLDAATPLLVKGGFYHAGQVCVSVQRIFAARPIAAGRWPNGWPSRPRR